MINFIILNVSHAQYSAEFIIQRQVKKRNFAPVEHVFRVAHRLSADPQQFEVRRVWSIIVKDWILALEYWTPQTYLITRLHNVIEKEQQKNIKLDSSRTLPSYYILWISIKNTVIYFREKNVERVHTTHLSLEYTHPNTDWERARGKFSVKSSILHSKRFFKVARLIDFIRRRSLFVNDKLWLNGYYGNEQTIKKTI